MPSPRTQLVGAFQPLKREVRLSDRLAEHLLQAIVSRGLKPGDRIPSELDLSAQFGVSRTVVREAVRSLAGKGVIETRRGTGITVAAVGASAVTESMGLFLHASSAIDYRKVHEVRSAIEAQVANLAAQRATPAELEALNQACQRMDRVLDDVEAASREDLEFHRALAAATHNELFLVLLDAVEGPLWEIRRETLSVRGRAAVVVVSHRRILERVEARDSAGSRREMREHLTEVERFWEHLSARDGRRGASPDSAVGYRATIHGHGPAAIGPDDPRADVRSGAGHTSSA